MLKRLLDVWYGPRAVRERDAPHPGGESWLLANGLVTTEDVAEAIRHAQDQFEKRLAEYPQPNGISTLTSAHSIGKYIEPADTKKISATGWGDVSFSIGWGEQLPPPNWTRFESRISITFIGGVARIQTHATQAAGGVGTQSDALHVALDALTRGQRRRTPPLRWMQLRWTTILTGLAALWLWTMLTTRPPLPVWLLSGVIVAIALTAVWRSFGYPDSDLRTQPRYFGGLQVDLTPREQVLADRANARTDWKIMWRTIFIAGPIGFLVGALLTRLTGLS